MLRRIKIKNPEKTYFISDPHFNHDHPEILAGRGAATVDELNEKTIAVWNETVPPDADVFLLGDVAFDQQKGAIKDHLKRLNFRTLHLLWGNHNGGVKKLYREQLATQFFPEKPAHANNYEIYPLRFSIGARKEVVFLDHYVEMEWMRPGEQKVTEIILCHYALRQWLHNSRGAWMLCGHSHGNDPALLLNAQGYGKILETSFEVIGAPKSLVQIAEIMDRKPKPAELNPFSPDDDLTPLSDSKLSVLFAQEVAGYKYDGLYWRDEEEKIRTLEFTYNFNSIDLSEYHWESRTVGEDYLVRVWKRDGGSRSTSTTGEAGSLEHAAMLALLRHVRAYSKP